MPYDHLRAEIWKVIEDPVGIIRSLDDTERIKNVPSRKKIVLYQRERNYLIGLYNCGVESEFGQHTHLIHPTDQEDIVRFQDDYARK